MERPSIWVLHMNGGRKMFFDFVNNKICVWKFSSMYKKFISFHTNIYPRSSSIVLDKYLEAGTDIAFRHLQKVKLKFFLQKAWVSIKMTFLERSQILFDESFQENCWKLRKTIQDSETASFVYSYVTHKQKAFKHGLDSFDLRFLSTLPRLECNLCFQEAFSFVSIELLVSVLRTHSFNYRLNPKIDFLNLSSKAQLSQFFKLKKNIPTLISNFLSNIPRNTELSLKSFSKLFQSISSLQA